MTSWVLLITAGALAAGVLMGWFLARTAGGAERARLKDTFAALSAEALRANNQQFLDLAETRLKAAEETARGELDARQQAIQQLVRPMEESLKRVDDRIGAVEKDRVGAYAELRSQVEEMGRGQQQLRLEAQNLVRALRTPHVRGAWGEIQLRRVVEMAGMQSHCYFVSETLSRQTVGLEPTDDGWWRLHLGPVVLGQLDARARLLHPYGRGLSPRKAM